MIIRQRLNITTITNDRAKNKYSSDSGAFSLPLHAFNLVKCLYMHLE